MTPTVNRIIPILGVVILVSALGVSLLAWKRKAAQPDVLTAVPQAPAPDADSPADTVRSLSARVADLLDQTRQLTGENRALRDQNQALIDQRTRSERWVRDQVRQEMDKSAHHEDSVLSGLTARVDQLAGKVRDAVGNGALGLPPVPAGTSTSSPASGAGRGYGDLPVGFGFDGTGEGASPVAIHWIEPLDAVPAGAGPADAGVPGSLLHTGTNPAPRGALPVPALAADARAALLPPREPVYTIPANATLIGSRAFTALVGRIPIGGQVQDPMPFKALIGAPNLAANGVEIPGLEGMVVSGFSVGDWTLSCVRGTVTSATFVFQDGHIASFGDKKRGQGGKEQEALGWISDTHGVPCVTGRRITNAPEFLTQRIGLSALTAAAEAAAASQTTTVVTDSGSAISSVTGETGKYVLGKTVAGGADETSKWLLERQANSFDAIFAPAGTPVVLHIDVELPIDYDPAGRRTDHRISRAGGTHGYLD